MFVLVSSAFPCHARLDVGFLDEDRSAERNPELGRLGVLACPRTGGERISGETVLRPEELGGAGEGGGTMAAAADGLGKPCLVFVVAAAAAGPAGLLKAVAVLRLRLSACVSLGLEKPATEERGAKQRSARRRGRGGGRGGGGPFWRQLGAGRDALLELFGAGEVLAELRGAKGGGGGCQQEGGDLALGRRKGCAGGSVPWQ